MEKTTAKKMLRFMRAELLQNRSGCRWGALLLAGALLLGTGARAQTTRTGGVVALDSAFNRLVAPGTTLEILASGLQNAEGPLWVADSAMLLFSDTKGRRVYRWQEGKGTSIFLKDAGYTGRLPYSDEPGTNGLALLGRDNLLLCNHGDRRISRYPLDGQHGQETVVDRYKRKRFNSPNDIAVASDGAVWFTDPPYGLPAPGLQEQPVHGVYRVAPGREPELQVSDLAFPNGLAFAPDGRTLYVSSSDSLRPRILAYRVGKNGRLSGGALFFDAGGLPRRQPAEVTDGLKTDSAGNVWATGPGGLLVLSPAGKLLGRIQTGEVLRNCAWGTNGWLYITAATFVYRIRTLSGG